MAARQSLWLTSFHGVLPKSFDKQDFTIPGDTCTGEDPKGNGHLGERLKGLGMGRSQQLVVFVVVVLSIMVYLSLRQFGPSPLIGSPPGPSVPIPS